MHQHLVRVEDLTHEEILNIFNKAESYLVTGPKTHKISYKKSQLLQNKTIFNLFFEPSTRTRSTFELAAKNLSANVINLNLDTSSIKKGESVKDTILTIKAMQADCIVLRHKQNGIAGSVAELCGEDLVLINAGDGVNSHPTQALLDMFTIYKHKKNFTDIKITIIGDILHSRVARSQIAALKILGCTNINLVGPEILLPDNTEFGNSVNVYHDLKAGIKDADVVSVLRLQKERMQHSLLLDDNDYFSNYGISQDILALAKPNAIVMHPGPINRNVEISSEVADGKQSVILQQVTNGVAIRMAVYDNLLG